MPLIGQTKTEQANDIAADVGKAVGLKEETVADKAGATKSTTEKAKDLATQVGKDMGLVEKTKTDKATELVNDCASDIKEAITGGDDYKSPEVPETPPHEFA